MSCQGHMIIYKDVSLSVTSIQKNFWRKTGSLITKEIEILMTSDWLGDYFDILLDLVIFYLPFLHFYNSSNISKIYIYYRKFILYYAYARWNEL